MNPQESWFKRKIIPIVFFVLFANLIALDLLLVKNFLGKKDESLRKTAASAINIIPTGAASTSNPQLDSEDCGPGCQKAIEDAFSSLKLTPTVKPIQQTIISERVILPTSGTEEKQQTVKEFFIPLGSGSSTATEWTDVSGAKAEVDSTKYPNIQKVLFEASVRVPNANQIVEVRLYNETDKYVVSNSEFLYPSGTSENFRIASIQLGTGPKTYKVQMKTQLGYSSVLDQARIHITTN